MEFQEKKVITKQRFNPFYRPNEKEWWYTGISDKTNKLYIGISVIRTKFIDSIDFSVYFQDGENENVSSKAGGKFYQAKYIGYLNCGSGKNKLDVSVNRGKPNKKFYFDYTDKEGGREQSDACDNHWELSFSSNKKNLKLKANLSFDEQIPRFTKYDNFFENTYTLLHYFQNTVTGTLQINDAEPININGLGYQDHCYGNVPRKTKWHWIAVQGEKCSLASLMNYGAFAQQYTEAFLGINKEKNNWIRLNQDVSFECYAENHFAQHWRISSPDMHLKCVIFAWNNQNNWIPLAVNLKHYQCYVMVSGHIRVLNEWKPTGEMYGVLEEHYGKW